MNYETRIEECKQIALKALNEIEAIEKEMKELESEYPKFNTRYWYTNEFGDVNYTDFDLGYKRHKHNYDTANCFQTEQEAQDELRSRVIETKLLRKIKELNDGWVPDWTDESYKYCLLISQEQVLCDSYNSYKHLHNKHYFKSASFKDQIIDHIGEEDLKWYLSR